MRPFLLLPSFLLLAACSGGAETGPVPSGDTPPAGTSPDEGSTGEEGAASSS